MRFVGRVLVSLAILGLFWLLLSPFVIFFLGFAYDTPGSSPTWEVNVLDWLYSPLLSVLLGA